MIIETLYPYTYISNSNWFVQESKIPNWTKEENKRFESALTLFDKETSDRWLKVAAMIPGKSDMDVKRHYEELEADVYDIEAGLVPIPGNLTSEFTLEFDENRGFVQESKIPIWTKEENKRFESALTFFDKETSDKWLKVAAMIPGKSDMDVKRHYEGLEADVYDMEAGLVPIPGNLTSEFRLEFVENRGFVQESKIPNWAKEENKRFESALTLFDKETSDRWLKVGAMIPGKSDMDVKRHYEELKADVYDIEAGLVPIPGNLTSEFMLEFVENRGSDPFRKRSATIRSSDQERKKRVPWTEDEHRRFLLGLQKHGKGDWRNISRNFVTSKTPTQVARHAQKYFFRQSSGGKDKRRPSIHDITIVNHNDTTQMENDDSTSMYKSNFLPPPHMSPSSPKMFLVRNSLNDGEAKVSNSTRGNPFIYDIGSHGGLKLQGHSRHMGPQNPALHIQATRQQDEELDELSASVERIGGVGLTIHEELLAQKKVAMVMKKAGAKGQIMMILFLVVLFIVLLVFVFLTLALDRNKETIRRAYRTR